MSAVALIKSFFETDNGRKLTMDELKALSPEERTWFAEEIANQRGLRKETDASGKTLYV